MALPCSVASGQPEQVCGPAAVLRPPVLPLEVQSGQLGVADLLQVHEKNPRVGAPRRITCRSLPSPPNRGTSSGRRQGPGRPTRRPSRSHPHDTSRGKGGGSRSARCQPVSGMRVVGSVGPGRTSVGCASLSARPVVRKSLQGHVDELYTAIEIEAYVDNDANPAPWPIPSSS